MIVNRDGQLFVAERIDIPGAWQFPQGGVDSGELPRDALCREVEEELGVPPAAYRILRERGGYRYDFPPGFKRWKKFRGQEQTYFLCELTADEGVIDPRNRSFPSFLPGVGLLRANSTSTGLSSSSVRYTPEYCGISSISEMQRELGKASVWHPREKFARS